MISLFSSVLCVADRGCVAPCGVSACEVFPSAALETPGYLSDAASNSSYCSDSEYPSSRATSPAPCTAHNAYTRGLSLSSTMSLDERASGGMVEFVGWVADALDEALPRSDDSDPEVEQAFRNLEKQLHNKFE